MIRPAFAWLGLRILLPACRGLQADLHLRMPEDADADIARFGVLHADVRQRQAGPVAGAGHESLQLQ